MRAANRTLFVVMFLMLLGGCAGTIKNMREAPLDKTAIATPEAGKAMIVFMRPSGMGYAVQSSVFEVKGEQPVLAGIVAAKAKVGYQVQPGKHLFMAIGETAEFMDADVLPDKTYYARVSPRMGMWKARFVLEPLKAEALASADFQGDFADCAWVEKSDESERWARENMASVQNKRAESFAIWQSAPTAEKQALSPEDGR